jgi:hypothetical protein
MSSVTIIFGTGWGRAGWNQGAWNAGGISSLSMAGAVNSVTAVEGTGVTVSPSAVQAILSFGTYSVGEGTGITIVESGVSAASAIGTGYTVSGKAVVSPTEVGSVSASFSLGTFDVTGGIAFSVTGVQAAGTTGTETVVEGTGIAVATTGTQAASATGTVTPASMVVGVTGISISGTINYPVIWQPIVPDQSPGWVPIGSRDAA